MIMSRNARLSSVDSESLHSLTQRQLVNFNLISPLSPEQREAPHWRALGGRKKLRGERRLGGHSRAIRMRPAGGAAWGGESKPSSLPRHGRPMGEGSHIPTMPNRSRSALVEVIRPWEVMWGVEWPLHPANSHCLLLLL